MNIFDFNVLSFYLKRRGCPRGVMVKAMDCGIVVRERYERYEPPHPPSCGLNSTTTVLLREWLWH